MESLPQRIVSVVPSQTELLYHLGLENEVVGITRFCVHPEYWFRTKTRVGGTKTLHLDRIEELNPSLILANKEENTKEQIDTLAAKYPVWVSEIYSLQDALEMVRTVGRLCYRQAEALELTENIEKAFSLHLPPPSRRLRVLYLIWRKPYMGVGSHTFIHHMLEVAGFDNVLANQTRYPTLSEAEIEALEPDAILLSSEPYPFKPIHEREFAALCPKAVITRVDGELFSWYGSRLLQSPPYFRTLRDELLKTKI